MIRRESKFQTLFRHWLRAYPMESAAFELKQTTTDSLPFSDVQEHQLDALEAAVNNGILYKGPDDSRGVKPFDFFYLRHSKAFVVIRYPKFFVLIDVFIFHHEKIVSDRKSLTSARAKEIGQLVIALH